MWTRFITRSYAFRQSGLIATKSCSGSIEKRPFTLDLPSLICAFLLSERFQSSNIEILPTLPDRKGGIRSRGVCGPRDPGQEDVSWEGGILHITDTFIVGMIGRPRLKRPKSVFCN